MERLVDLDVRLQRQAWIEAKVSHTPLGGKLKKTTNTE
jgi:hypothetical protein